MRAHVYPSPPTHTQHPCARSVHSVSGYREIRFGRSKYDEKKKKIENLITYITSTCTRVHTRSNNNEFGIPIIVFFFFIYLRLYNICTDVGMYFREIVNDRFDNGRPGPIRAHGARGEKR